MTSKPELQDSKYKSFIPIPSPSREIPPGRGGIILRRLALCFLAAAAVLPAQGSPIAYDITFTVVNQSAFGATLSNPYGSFTYDAAKGFSNFNLYWGNATFDFTDAADHPILPPIGGTQTGCGADVSDYEYGFAILTGATAMPPVSCAGNVTPSFLWLGQYLAYEDLGQFDFVLGVPSAAQDQIIAQTAVSDASTLYEVATGTWTVTQESPLTPEPGSMWLMLLGTLAVVARGLPDARRPRT